MAKQEKPLEKVEGIATRLLTLGKNDLTCMEAVFTWALAAKKEKVLKEVLV